MMDDPRVFARFWWNKGLTPAQEEFLLSVRTENHVVFLSTRQGGKTEAQALAALDALLFDHIRTGSRVIIESYAPTQKQAKEVVFERVRELLRTGMHYTGPPVPPGMDPQDPRNPRNNDRNWLRLMDEVMPGQSGIQERGMIKMRNGNVFRVQTASDGANVRGYSPTIIQIDESASINSTMYWSDIRGAGKALKGLTAEDFDAVRGMPPHEQQEFMATRGIHVRYWETGTPLGQNHFFKVAQPGSGAKVIKQPWWECPITNRAQVEADRNDMPPRQFEAEYCCVFNTDSNMLLDRAQVDSACSLDPNASYRPKPGARYVAGIDLGQRVDHSVLSIFELIGPIRKMVFHYRWDLNRQWTDMVNEMNEFISQWNVELVLVDRTGPNGRTIFEGYLVHFGWNLEGWMYTPDSKGELMRYLQLQFQQEKVELWRQHDLMRELSNVEEKRLPGTGKPTYPKPEDGDGHDDQVQAVALALMAGAMVSPNMDGVDMGIVFGATHQESNSPFGGNSPFSGLPTDGSTPSPWRDSGAPEVDGRPMTSPWDFGGSGGRGTPFRDVRRPRGW
jgi:hypothetical protein